MPNKVLSILVVEPNTDHHLLIGYGCRVNGHQVDPVFASTAEDALNYLAGCTAGKTLFPRLVLLDLLLPHAEAGLHLIERIRNGYPRLPIIVLSHHQHEDDVLMAYNLGVNSFITKPHDLQRWEALFQILLSYWLNVVTMAPF